MNYFSTRDLNKKSVSAGEAICKGLAPDGGLYLPETCPAYTIEELSAWQNLSYVELAAKVLKPFLTDYTEEQLFSCVQDAYHYPKFDDSRIAPTRLCKDYALLELWHGPTSAFKDLALQLLPRLMVTARKNLGISETSLILVATSGDTGKAALEGFKDVDGTKIAVFYPKYGVSALQQLQMQTQEGENVAVFGIKGNFDDAQTGVKTLFTDREMEETLKESNMSFSSANSINWGRLCPQIVYYFASYFDLVSAGKVQMGEKVNFCVPTGNFGDILAGYYAKMMGLPVHKLICASNANRVLTDFFATGTYDRNREFHQTASPSMDILISSNLERLLFLASEQDASLISDLFASLKEEGSYTVSKEILCRLQADFAADCCSDEEAFEVIARLFETEGVLIDPHTAVGVCVLEKYRKTSGDMTECVVLSTASPYKFCKDVLFALEKAPASQEDPFFLLEELENKSGVAAPFNLKNLKNAAVRFDRVLEKEEQKDAVLRFVAES